MVTVNKFLCMTLRTTGIVFGWLGLIASLFSITVCSLIISQPEHLTSHLSSYQNQYQYDTQPQVQLDPRTIIGVYSFGLALSIIDLLAAGFLIYGTIKENHLMILPWLLNHGVAIVLRTLGTIVVFIAMIVIGLQAWAIILILAICGLGISIYSAIWVAIFSLFKDIKLSAARSAAFGHESLEPYTLIHKS